MARALLEFDKKVLVRDEGQERTGLARYIEELVDILVAVSAQSCGHLHEFYKDQEHDMCYPFVTTVLVVLNVPNFKATQVT